MGRLGGRMFKKEGITSAKALRRECIIVSLGWKEDSEWSWSTVT